MPKEGKKKKKGPLTRLAQTLPGMAPEGSYSEDMTRAADKMLARGVKEFKELKSLLRSGDVDMGAQGASLKATEEFLRKLGTKKKRARAEATASVKRGFK